jgi:serine/threonine-protein kinase HipA
MFNVLMQNTDDHLRNLGFLARDAGKWGLSPPRRQSRSGGMNDPEDGDFQLRGNVSNVDAVIEAAPYFDVEVDEAASIASAAATSIKDEWRAIGSQFAMTSADFRAIPPAMDNAQVERALALGRSVVPGGTGV